MRKTIASLNIVIIILLILSTSCSKYEEGPFISFQTKTERLVRSWERTEVLENGEPSGFGGSVSYFFSEDGTGGIDYFAEDATILWEFDKKKENLLIKVGSNSEYKSYKILRLTEDELWLENSWDEYVLTEKYIPHQ